MTKYFFLSGIARSGSTLLGSILNQNPEIYTSPTSPLLDLYCLTEESLQNLSNQYTFDLPTISPNIHKSLHHAYYSNITSGKSIIIDKHRGWARNINTIKQIITPNPKVICTYRPIQENIVSFIKLASKDPNNFIDTNLKKQGKQINTYNRAMAIWQNYSSDPFYSMQHGLQYHRDNIVVINYDDLVVNPSAQLEKVYDFLEIQKYDHVFDSVVNTCKENDKLWGMKDLHTLRTKLEKTSDDPLEVLGDKLYEYFDNIDKQLRKFL